MSVLSRSGQGAFCGRLCSGMQEGPERHPAPGHGSPAPGGQARGHGSAGIAGHRGKRGQHILLYRETPGSTFQTWLLSPDI